MISRTSSLWGLFPALCISVFLFVLLTNTIVQRNKNVIYSNYVPNALISSSNDTEPQFPVPRTIPQNNNRHILLWTSFFGENEYIPSPSSKTFHDCSFDNCIVTSDRNLLNRSSVIVFHWSDIDSTQFPSYRTAEQYWVLLILESPSNTPDFSEYNGIMNLTASYRLDSDIFAPYINVRLKTNKEMSENVATDYTTNKTKMVAWFVSNCHTSSNREEYVEELKQHLDVDIYGSCGDHSCYPKMSFDCYNNIAKEYYFYLSFENSICKDYVTEKYFHILESKPGMVPVVLSGGNFKRIGPPGAYIDVMNFTSPMALANYLKKVSSNSALYNSYFNWRRHYTLGGHHWVCDACRLLNQPIRNKRVINDFKKWWREDAQCQRWNNGKFHNLP